MSKTLLAIGAHYDDCVFGIPGTLLKAVKKGYRVVVLSVIGDYRNWSPVGPDRHDAFIEGVQRICRDRGVEIRFLNYRSMGFSVNEESRGAVCEVVADVQPDVGLLLWPHDTHPDHEVTSALSKIAFQWSSAVLEKPGIRRPSRLYYYDNGPRHTIGFEPDTFLDISDVWVDAAYWLGLLMALVFGEDSRSASGAVEAKEALAVYRGKTAGVQYSEALRSFVRYPVEIL